MWRSGVCLMVMVGSHFWRGRNGRNKCSERTRTRCTDHADCCAVTACTYCLELEIYGEDIQYGVADQSDSHWTGTVGGYSFDMFWDRDYETEECVLIVEFDGEEVYRKSCYEGQSCRDSSDEVTVMVGYDEATLRWIKHEPLSLPHISDPDTGCKTWFCGECECSCECLCVTIRDILGLEIAKGEICNISYPCDGPVWYGTVGYYALSLALERDSYGNCVLAATINGDYAGTFAVSGCKDLSATIELYDGTTIEVRCKICSCSEPFACCPNIDQPDNLYITLSKNSVVCACLDGQVIALHSNGSRLSFIGIWPWPCIDPGNIGSTRWFRFTTTCEGGQLFNQIVVTGFWQLSTLPPPDENDARFFPPFAPVYTYYKSSGQCDPFHFHYTVDGGLGNGVWVRCEDNAMDSPDIEMDLTL